MISPDTKLDLTANPLRFLARAANLWNSDLPFGQAQNQAYGYLFPHGAFFLAGDLLGLPGWMTQRLWWALLLTVGFWGLLRVAEALGIGNTSSRVIVAAAAFALSPAGADHPRLDLLGDPADDAGALGAAAGHPGDAWRQRAGSPRILAAQCGRRDGARWVRSTRWPPLTACLPALIWWACHRPNRQWLRFSAWWLLSRGAGRARGG